MELKKLVIISGYFDPLHEGHLFYIDQAKKIADNGELVCIVNSDRQCQKKNGMSFLNEKVRVSILSHIKGISWATISCSGDRSVCTDIEQLARYAKTKKIKEVIFAKGGDRTAKEIPEAKICKKLGIKIIDGLGEKIDSSSKILENYYQFKLQKRKFSLRRIYEKITNTKITRIII